MDYTNYNNSIMVCDNSAWQPLTAAMVYHDVPVFRFLSDHNITVAISNTAMTAGEFSSQSYNHNLFSGQYAVSASLGSVTAGNIAIPYALSTSDGRLTTLNVDPSAYPIKVMQIAPPPVACLWESSVVWTKLSDPDRSILRVARELAGEGKNIFILANDKKIIKQSEIEGYKYLRSARFLAWMHKEKYITGQKGRRVIEMWKKRDPGAIFQDAMFRDILLGR
ncbi:MAG: hypothetical protein Q7S48_00375 [bacterium]|nr:hypothetical protein [bacterium]